MLLPFDGSSATSRFAFSDASSCPVAISPEASKSKSLRSDAPDSGEGSVSRVRVPVASVAWSLLQHAAFALRLFLQRNVFDLWRVARTLRRHPRDLHRPRCTDLQRQRQQRLMNDGHIYEQLRHHWDCWIDIKIRYKTGLANRVVIEGFKIRFRIESRIRIRSNCGSVRFLH